MIFVVGEERSLWNMGSILKVKPTLWLIVVEVFFIDSVMNSKKEEIMELSAMVLMIAALGVLLHAFPWCDPFLI